MVTAIDHAPTCSRRIVRRSWALTLLALTALLLGGLPGDATAAPDRSADEARAEARLVAEHDAARSDPGRYGYGELAGQPALTRADDLDAVARAWSDTMAADGQLRHNPDVGEQVCCWRAWGENVAWVGPISAVGDVEATADRLFRNWMDSDGHRANLMGITAAYDEVGIGATIDDDGVLWATAVFRLRDG